MKYELVKKRCVQKSQSADSPTDDKTLPDVFKMKKILIQNSKLLPIYFLRQDWNVQIL